LGVQALRVARPTTSADGMHLSGAANYGTK
jgi:hypothetical protein